MLTRAMLTVAMLARPMFTRAMLARAVLTGTMVTRAMLIRRMMARATVASAMLTVRVHTDIDAVFLAFVHMDVDGILARVDADVHGILTGIHADVRTRPGVTAGTRTPARSMPPVNVNIHVPGVIGNLDVDELVDPVAFGHGFLR
jgi:hypothetical protein